MVLGLYSLTDGIGNEFAGKVPRKKSWEKTKNKFQEPCPGRYNRQIATTCSQKETATMWNALALSALVLAPAQADQLSISNVRELHGFMGIPRAESKVLPGDLLVIAFDIDNIKIDEDGKASFS